MELHDKRENYSGTELTIDNTISNPFEFLKEWVAFAIDKNIYDATAVTLSTVSADAKPSSRILLMKEITEDGVLFFTNYNSRKAQDLDANPNASMVLFWPTLHRQVRLEGVVEKVDREKSVAYFQSRPLASQRSAIVSEQSSPIVSKDQLHEEVNNLAEQYGDSIHSCPEYWGGYLFKVNYFEFWQGQRNRFHDRICYRLEANNWTKQMLAP